jgi:GDP-mannose transporter
MSRPSTPRGISPRGSYVNLLEGREEGAFSPSKIEKERLRAEAEVKASLLKEKDGEKSKEEAPIPAGSPGMSSSS